MPYVTSKAYLYVVPVKAEVTVVDEDFHRMGDINRDGVIDEYDSDIFGEAYGSRPGDPNWNPDCDFDEDGVVGPDDFGTLGVNFGKTAPSYYTPFTAEVSPGMCVLNGKYRRQKLKATAYTVNSKKVLFFFSALGILGRVIVI